MRKYIIALPILLSLLLALHYNVNAQSLAGNIKNFQKQNHHASNQNWSVGCADNSYIYFANHSGLLEFNGVDWHLYELPNKTTMRSLLVVSDSLIYTAGYRELGFWKPNEEGTLSYHSLNHLAEKYFSNNEEFWNIISLNNKVYFHSFSSLLVYEDGTINQIKLNGFTDVVSCVDNEIYIASRTLGISKLEDNELIPLIEASATKEAMIRFILPLENGKLLIGTNSEGMFVYSKQGVEQWNPSWQEYFEKNKINRGHISPEGNLIVGTILDGIVVFDLEGNKIAHYNTENGLQNNTVLGISTDLFGNIWLALDRGINFISNDNNYGIKIETIADIGAVYAAAIFENHIYLGTNQGLFRKALSQSNSNYELVPETQNQVWYCKVLDKQLFVGHNEGTIIIKDGKQKFVSRQAGGFAISKDPNHGDRLIESTYTNIIRMKKDGNTYVQDSHIKGFSNLIRYIEVSHLGDIWLSHMHRGIYQLKLNTQQDSVVSTKYFGANSVFKKDNPIHVFKVENRVVFTTEDKLFTYDDLNNEIIEFEFLNARLGKFCKASKIIEAFNHHYWFITKESIALFYIFDQQVSLKKEYSRALFAKDELVAGFENILPINEHEAIVCLERGIAWVNTQLSDSISEIKELKPQISKLIITNKEGKKHASAKPDEHIKLRFRHNNIETQYSFPLFTHSPIYFQTRMQGLEQEWSSLLSSPKINFDRLPVGEYTLQVKAVDLRGNESKINSLQIEVLPPWYDTNSAKIIYILVLVFALFAFRAWGIKHNKKKERKIKEKQEQELIHLRNEKLNNEIKHKSRELANSTMAIIKKNEFLLDLKEIISKQKEQLGIRFPDKYFNLLNRKIDENMSCDDDWKLFETHFELAHEQFLKKLKAEYPELTSKDLRLCAYLRMNLSSKEIAPLLGISVRGVENHRYRLRKKMYLEHDENLTEIILSF